MVEPRDLLGDWRLSRAMTDHATGRAGSASGLLRVEEQGGGLRWAERVQLTWAGRTVPATRDYLLEPDRAGGWWMCFADGRPFHPWCPGVEVEHACGADLYRGLVSAEGADVRVRWRVTGPAKDLTLSTLLRR